MKLKLDENLGKTAALMFQSAGYDARTVLDQGLSGAPDREVIGACQAEQRCLVTLDLDFANPMIFDPTAYTGIAVIRLPSRISYQDLANACSTLIAGMKEEPIFGKLWIIQKGRIREYQREDRGQRPCD
ncbi:MAG: DUF5615 family PIN-like protein [Phycisphaerales bacterium]